MIAEKPAVNQPRIFNATERHVCNNRRGIAEGSPLDVLLSFCETGQFMLVKRWAVIFTFSTQPLVDYLLSVNTHNRKPKENEFNQIARDILAGEYEFTGQGIGVCEDGTLSDGQNRLLAIRKAEYPELPLLIVAGLSPKAQAVVDRHARRTLADTLTLLLNQTVTRRLVSYLNILFRVEGLGQRGIEFRWNKGSSSSTPSEMATMMSLWPEAMPIASATDVNASVGGAIIAFARHYSLEVAQEFLSLLKTGANLEEDSPVLRLRNAMGRIKSWDSWAKMHMLRLTVSACKAFAAGQTLSLLKESQAW